ncbi:MAG: disulfide oxidoreductase [Rubellimicrobium sp.]|nr:disulfide oxidoreductase [Rubellimicrobium sp.]
MTPARVTAVLGPTNTGKTHYAIERMLGHRTGIIGLPLRLLAREVYDRIVRARGPSVVALMTGEERIIPERPHYWVCTTEAMPEGMGADFLAVDEIQLCADPERGHVFTDRLLHARGLVETMFMGSETMRGAIAALVPGTVFLRRERFSTLTHTGPKKIGRLPERTAIVGFSVESVYAIAEYIRRTRGGAAVVMGALSPRTRNAQVALYQAGEVDFLVATDAIGMGLNLDIAHVAFAGLGKFDGHRMRDLAPDELAQIAGRAGRHLAQGTFGTTADAPDLDPETVAQIESHQFRPVTRLMWRNARLEFGSIERLVRALEARTDNPWLGRVRESDDLAALRALAADPVMRARASDGRAVRLLWDVCRVPDFRGISRGDHAQLLGTIFAHLHERGTIPRAWLAAQVRALDRPEGDIDTLSRRLAHIRTWTYVAQRAGWVDDESHWREETRAVEDRLSDALHGALTQAFVDRRTSVLARRLRQKEILVAEVNDRGEVTVEEQFVGRIEGFRFRIDRTDNPEEARTLRAAAFQALAPQFHLRADRFYNAPDTELDFTEQGGLMWGEHAVGRLARGADALRPQVIAFVDDEAGPEVAAKVQRRLQHFIDRRIAATMEPLLALQRDEALSGLARGLAFRLVEHLGIIPRGEVAEDVKALDQEARAGLRKLGVRFGQFTVFMPPLLKPAPTRLRLVLWGLMRGLDEIPPGPPAGHVTVPAARDVAPGYYAMAGYRAAGERAIRIDMLERLADLLRERDSKAGFEAVPEMLSITGLSLELFAGLMGGLGYRALRGERPRQRSPRPAPAAVADAVADTAVTEAVAEGAGGAGPVAEVAADPAVPATDAVAEAMPDSVPGTAPESGRAPVPEAAPESLDGVAAESAGDADAGPAADHARPASRPPEPATEVFYTFTWAGRGQRRDHGGGRGNRDQNRDQNRDRSQDRNRGGPRGDRHGAAPAQPPAGEAAPAPAAAAESRPHPDGRRRDDRPQGPRPARKDRPQERGHDRPARSGDGEGADRAPRHNRPRDDRRPPREDRNKPQVFEARPPREDRRKVDPDSPFAALAELMKPK